MVVDGYDDLVTLLGGKEYQRFEPREQYIGSDHSTNGSNHQLCLFVRITTPTLMVSHGSTRVGIG